MKSIAIGPLVLAACWAAPPRSPSTAVDDRVSVLRHTAHVALVDRDAQLVAGYIAWKPGEVVPPLAFRVLGLDGKQDGAIARDERERVKLDTRVANYLARGHWHPMISAVEVSARNWSFPGTPFTAIATADGSIEFHAPSGVVHSPPTARPKGERFENGAGSCDLDGVRVQQLAYDPQSHLAWLVFEVDPETGMDCGWYDLSWSFYVPISEHAREPFERK